MYQTIEIALYVLILMIISLLHWRKGLRCDSSKPIIVTPRSSLVSPQKNIRIKSKSATRRSVTHQPTRPKREYGAVEPDTSSKSDDNWRQNPCPPAPPPSPVSIGGSDDYLANIRFLQSLEVYHEEEVYLTESREIEGINEAKPVIPSPAPKDEDHERRSSYCKNSITSGEEMVQIGEYKICQFFIHGIEYHFCVSILDGTQLWDLPEEIREVCTMWYLQCPRHKRRKVGLSEPPSIAEVSTADETPGFITHVTTY